MKFLDRGPDYYRNRDSLPMLRRVVKFGSLYQMTAVETVTTIANHVLEGSDAHPLVVIPLVLGCVLGLPYIFSVVAPKRFEKALQQVDKVMRENNNLPPLRRD